MYSRFTARGRALPGILVKTLLITVGVAGVARVAQAIWNGRSNGGNVSSVRPTTAPKTQLIVSPEASDSTRSATAVPAVSKSSGSGSDAIDTPYLRREIRVAAPPMRIIKTPPPRIIIVGQASPRPSASDAKRNRPDPVQSPRRTDVRERPGQGRPPTDARPATPPYQGNDSRR